MFLLSRLEHQLHTITHAVIPKASDEVFELGRSLVTKIIYSDMQIRSAGRNRLIITVLVVRVITVLMKLCNQLCGFFVP